MPALRAVCTAGLPLRAAGHHIVRAITRERPAIVKGPDHPDAVCCEVLQEHGKVAVMAVEIVKMHDIRLKAPQLANQPLRHLLRDKAVPPAQPRPQCLNANLAVIGIADPERVLGLPDGVQNMVFDLRASEGPADLPADHPGAAGANRVDLYNFDLYHLPEETIRKDIQRIGAWSKEEKVKREKQQDHNVRRDCKLPPSDRGGLHHLRHSNRHKDQIIIPHPHDEIIQRCKHLYGRGQQKKVSETDRIGVELIAVRDHIGEHGEGNQQQKHRERVALAVADAPIVLNDAPQEAEKLSVERKNEHHDRYDDEKRSLHQPNVAHRVHKNQDQCAAVEQKRQCGNQQKPNRLF